VSNYAVDSMKVCMVFLLFNKKFFRTGKYRIFMQSLRFSSIGKRIAYVYNSSMEQNPETLSPDAGEDYPVVLSAADCLRTFGGKKL